MIMTSRIPIMRFRHPTSGNCSLKWKNFVFRINVSLINVFRSCISLTTLSLSYSSLCFSEGLFFRKTSDSLLDVKDSPDRIDNISDTALKAFQEHYRDDTITKDDIFDYVYGILHAPSYREQFA